MEVDCSVDFLGVQFPNPFVLASGILGVAAESWLRSASLGVGGITTKSIWRHPHPGHKNPTMFGTDSYFMNAVGLSDAGLEKAIEEINHYLSKNNKNPLIVNIVGGSERDFIAIAEAINELPKKPALVEVNMSCPNVENEFGKPFACDLRSAEHLTKNIRKVLSLPFSVKLSPNVPHIAEIAKACEGAGADAITAINTVGPGMRFNIDLKKPILSNKVGGISGPAIFPIAVKAVFEIYQAVSIPIIATGGVNSGRDALEIMMAGGRLVGVGTALYYHGESFWKKALTEMQQWLQKEGIKNIEDIIGLFHRL